MNVSRNSAAVAVDDRTVLSRALAATPTTTYAHGGTATRPFSPYAPLPRTGPTPVASRRRHRPNTTAVRGVLPTAAVSGRAADGMTARHAHGPGCLLVVAGWAGLDGAEGAF